jgi:molecular chaperone DnaJ
MRQSFLGSFVNVATCPVCGGSGETITDPCTVCHGNKQVQETRTLNVKVPAGVDNDTQIRLTNEGGPGVFGGPSGNLYVVLHVSKHDYFQRRGDDIILEMEINIAQATLGDEIEIPTVDGPDQLVVSSGTQSGSVFRLKDRGVPHLRRNGRGDQLVVVHVVVPKNLTDEQKELMQKLARTLGKEVIPQRGKGIFSQLKDALGDVLGVSGF